MVDSAVSRDFEIKSHKGSYTVAFKNSIKDYITGLLKSECIYIVDARVATLFKETLSPILQGNNVIIVEATEANKSIELIIPLVEKLVSKGIRKNYVLVAIGGGIIQDITCFIASTLYRGLAWKFIPTTLLAQADSCIGSKSSINLGNVKNILGTFNPPNEVIISSEFLTTLSQTDINSGLGEILKVHAIESAVAFDELSNNYDLLFSDSYLLQKYIESSLIIKKRFIEADEFDKGIRNIFNYGHSFGHAIEAATDFGIPHGIAVSIGMDLANRISSWRGLTSEEDYLRMHSVLAKNYRNYASFTIPSEKFFPALMKDKKNTSDKLVLILPVGTSCNIEKVEVAIGDSIESQSIQFLGELSK